MSSNALPPKLVSSDILVRLCVMSSSTFFEAHQAAGQSSLWIRGEVHFPTSRALQNREFDLPFVNLPQNLIFSGHAAKAFAQYLSSSEQRKKEKKSSRKTGANSAAAKFIGKKHCLNCGFPFWNADSKPLQPFCLRLTGANAVSGGKWTNFLCKQLAKNKI